MRITATGKAKHSVRPHSPGGYFQEALALTALPHISNMTSSEAFPLLILQLLCNKTVFPTKEQGYL